MNRHLRTRLPMTDAQLRPSVPAQEHVQQVAARRQRQQAQGLQQDGPCPAPGSPAAGPGRAGADGADQHVALTWCALRMGPRTAGTGPCWGPPASRRQRRHSLRRALSLKLLTSRTRTLQQTWSPPGQPSQWSPRGQAGQAPHTFPQ